jgi:hypothetical protein
MPWYGEIVVCDEWYLKKEVSFYYTSTKTIQVVIEKIKNPLHIDHTSS